MISVVPAASIDERKQVLKHMPFAAQGDEENVLGVWDDGNCIGGAGITTINDIPNVLSFELAHNGEIDKVKIMRDIFRHYFNIYKQIYAIIDIPNHRAYKACKQMGFKLIYREPSQWIMVLDAESWRYNKKWPL